MSIYLEKKEVAPGVFKELYTVIAEGVNKYTGKRVQNKRRGINSKPKAQKIYMELWNQCRDERPDGPPIKSWGELKAAYLSYVQNNVRSETNKHGFSPKTVEKKKSRFIHLPDWNDLHLDLINPQLLREKLDELEAQGVATRELTSEIQKEVKCVLGYAVDRGTLKTNPLAEMTKRMVPKKKKKALNHEETNKLLSEARARKHPYFFIWLLSVTLGVRRSELAGLKWLDIDFENRLVNVTRQLIPKEGLVEDLKNHKERIVAIPAYVVPILKEYKLRSKSEFVIDIDCKQWKGGHQAAVLRKFCQEIGIKEVTHHRLRATHITLALVDGIPLGIVKENVGHSKLSTTDEYFSSSGIQMRGQTDGLRIKVPSGMEAEVTPLRAVK
jgi:integrase